MKPFLTVFGHVTIDQIVSIPHFPALNETVDILSKKTTLGGTGTNIAITAARLGVPTALAALVGPDLPQVYRDEIRDSGLIDDEIIPVDGYETSSCIIMNDSGLRQKVIFYQGPQAEIIKTGIDLSRNAMNSEHVHFCTGEPLYYIALARKLRAEGIKVAGDPSQETYRRWVKENLRKLADTSDIFFCNSFEAKAIEERLGLKSVFDIGPRLVVRTDGEEGSMASIDGEIFRIPAVKGAAAVDATGCGDSFRAGFYSGLYHGYSEKESLVLAAAVSSFVLEKTGALTNTPTWDMVEERAKGYMRD